MARRKLTINALEGLYSNANNQSHSTGDGRGTKTNPYTISEVEPLIDNGTFEGGYVKDENGQVSYWLGVATVMSSSSNSDQYDYIDFNSDFLDDDFWQNWGSNSGLDDLFSSEVTSVSGYLGDGTDVIENTGKAIEQNAGKTRIGTDGRFRFETKTGRVFYGNQYVATTSLEGLGQLIRKHAGRANLGIAVYNVAAATYNDGIEAGAKEIAITAAGCAGAELGLKAGALLGTAVAPGLGTGVGAIAGIVAGIILGVGGSIAGSYIVEIGLE